MFIELDEPSALDPIRVGGKAAALAKARAAGAAVLAGFVVEASASREHMALGSEALGARGSGGARLAVSGAPLHFADDLVERAQRLAPRTVARSSTLLERSGEWSGAFASYIDLEPGQLPKAVVGCWSSAFAVAALQRQEAAGIVPGSWPMAILVQPSIDPQSGGWAELGDDGTVQVYGVKGSPAPLLQGWVSGQAARYDGAWTGELADLVGDKHLESVREALVLGAEVLGANRCEWAVDDRVWVLQLDKAATATSASPPADRSRGRVPDELADVVRSVVSAPGRLGDEAVLPWALTGLAHVELTDGPLGSEPIRLVTRLARELTEEVWGLPWSVARPAADRLMAALRGGSTGESLPALQRLRRPDPARAGLLLGTLRSLRLEMVEMGIVANEAEAWHLGLEDIAAAREGRHRVVPTRVGMGPWEPLVANVVLACGDRRRGTAASSGTGAGPGAGPPRSGTHRAPRRAVLTATHPLPALASLLWDASALVTATGSPAAHLFEAARALRVPAVCGVDIDGSDAAIVAVDGDSGEVATMALSWEI